LQGGLPTAMSKVPKRRTPITGQIFRKIAPKIGATILIEPNWRMAGQITFKDGRRSYFKYNTIDINSRGAADIADDKDFARFFMARMGYPTAPGRAFYSDRWCAQVGSRQDINAAYRHAANIGFPVFVKPNSGSQGINVAKVFTRQQFYRAMRSIFAEDTIALVQPELSGNDYRVVVLDGKVISAYQRFPLSVRGDGTSSVAQLWRAKQRSFARARRDTTLQPGDRRIRDYLAGQRRSLKSVPDKGEQVVLLANANLSCGGDSTDVTDRIHPSFSKMAIRLTRDMGLRLCGVDLIVKGSIEDPARKYWVLEINSSPGLDHYARSGAAQRKIVEELYLEVLKSMERAV
jgi:D-alanine-D-alanine ligase-like ATP-grasp enzyme